MTQLCDLRDFPGMKYYLLPRSKKTRSKNAKISSAQGIKYKFRAPIKPYIPIFTHLIAVLSINSSKSTKFLANIFYYQFFWSNQANWKQIFQKIAKKNHLMLD